MPFVCTLDSCRTPNTLFESSKDWVAHMRNQHADGYWSCMDRAHDSALSFNSVAEFKKHMSVSHARGFEAADLDDILDSCFERRPRDLLLVACPFCPRDESEEIDLSDLVNHVGHHLIELSQISVANHGPEIDEQTDSLSSQISRAGQNARSRSTSAAKSLVSSTMTIDSSKAEDPDIHRDIENNYQLSKLLSSEHHEADEENWDYVYNITQLPYDSSTDEIIQNLRNFIFDGEHRVRRRSISLGSPFNRINRHPGPAPIHVTRNLEQAHTEGDPDAKSESERQGDTSGDSSEDEATNIKMLISRYRRTGGMSASVGFRYDRGVNSTSGGYVLLDGHPYLLLSDTMVEAHFERLARTNEIFSKSPVISPSSGDLKELRDLAVRYMSVAESSSKRSSTVSDNSSSLLANLEDLLQIDSLQNPTIDTKTRVTTIIEERYRAEVAYSVGNIIYRSTPRFMSSKERIQPVGPVRMSWSLCMVDNPQGVVPNRFRSMSLPREGLEPSNIDIGKYCTETCAMEPNASVYYVGRGGIRTGKIGLGMSLAWPREEENLEWYLQIDGQIVQEELSGDEGAWVLRCDGNQLMAQLWGYTNERLVITPIDYLFHDIKDVTGATWIELPKDA